MPWTADDSSKHVKGLSASAAKKWASVANDVLRRCQEKDGADCEGRALRAAAAAVKSK